jgi:hypothetical protein
MLFNYDHRARISSSAALHLLPFLVNPRVRFLVRDMCPAAAAIWPRERTCHFLNRPLRHWTRTIFGICTDCPCFIILEWCLLGRDTIRRFHSNECCPWLVVMVNVQASSPIQSNAKKCYYDPRLSLYLQFKNVFFFFIICGPRLLDQSRWIWSQMMLWPSLQTRHSFMTILAPFIYSSQVGQRDWCSSNIWL